MKLAIILVNWKNENQTVSMLENISNWKQIEPRIWVIDNDAKNTTQESQKQFKLFANYIPLSANLGYGAANNKGMEMALAENSSFILLLNSDVKLEEGDLLNLLDKLNTQPDLKIIGPCLKEKKNDLVYIGGRDIANHINTRVEIDSNNRKSIKTFPFHFVEYVPGTMFLFIAELINDIGYLDENYFFSGEIADFCKRARSIEGKIAVDLETEVLHQIGNQESKLRESLYLYYNFRNRFLYINKNFPDSKRIKYFYWISVALRKMASALLQRKAHMFRAAILALIHGIRGKFGNANQYFIAKE